MKKGDSVIISGGRRRYLVIDGPNKKGEYSIQSGRISILARRELLERVPTPKGGRSKVQAKRRGCAPITTGAAKLNQKELFIDLHGHTASEALAKVERAIDRAIICDCEKLAIMHGIGEGILKERVHEYLESSRQVLSYHLDDSNPGVTKVEL